MARSGDLQVLRRVAEHPFGEGILSSTSEREFIVKYFVPENA